MVLMTHCCCCIPLRAGCIIIGVLYIIANIHGLTNRKELLDHLVPEENEDEENKKQRNKVKIVEIIRCMENAFMIIVACVLIYAAIQKKPSVLKVCAGILAIMAIVNFLFFVVIIPGASNTVLSDALELVFLLYLSAVIYSFAQELEEPDEPQVVVIGRAYGIPEPAQMRSHNFPRYPPSSPYFQGPRGPYFPHGNPSSPNFDRPVSPQTGNRALHETDSGGVSQYSPGFWTRPSP